MRHSGLSVLVAFGSAVFFVSRAGADPVFFFSASQAYSSFADSPFNSPVFEGIVVEDFEDGLLNTPGVSVLEADATALAPGELTDSVDLDDGVPDGHGNDGWSFFRGVAASPLRFQFDAPFPTAAGLVWTDGTGDVRFEAFDASGASLGAVEPGRLDDGDFGGGTAEDRFFGVADRGGIGMIQIQVASSGIEVDHLQFGTFIPEPAAGASLVVTALGWAHWRRRPGAWRDRSPRG